MIAYDSDAEKIKHYRVDKMVNLKLLPDKRDGERFFKDFDMALYSKKTFGMYRGEEEIVTLRCKNYLAGVIVDRFGQDIIFRKTDDEYFEISVKVSVSPLFLSWVLNFGTDILIVSPQNVKDEYVSLLEKTLKQYQ